MDAEATPLSAEREAELRAILVPSLENEGIVRQEDLRDLLAALDSTREQLRLAEQQNDAAHQDVRDLVADVRDLAAALAEAAGALTVLHGRWKLKYPVFNEDGDWEALGRDIKRFEWLLHKLSDGITKALAALGASEEATNE